MRRNRALTAILVIGVALLVALSVANLVVSKKNEARIDRLVSYRLSQVLQSKDFQQTIDNSVQGSLSKIVVTPQKGDKGDSGQSIIGPEGNAGVNGKDGVSVMGKSGNNGNNGKDGQSAYDIWLAQGNTGTEADFLTSLVGPTGDQGSPGKTLEIQWNAGVLESKYTSDDFWVAIPTAP